jgi:hypothetical protein
VTAMKEKITLLAMIIVLIGCDRGVSHLSHGYSYVQIDGVNGMIIADGSREVVVQPNVKRYAEVGYFIVGERSDAELNPNLSKKFGYFIFDTLHRSYVEGLSEQEFEKQLKARRLPPNPLGPS